LKTFLAAETMERLGFSPNLDAKLFRTDWAYRRRDNL
jgi:hypothetical protein